MNYSKLVFKLRKKAYEYSDEIKFSRVLKEAKRRMLNSEEHKRHEATRTRIQDEKLLFRTR